MHPGFLVGSKVPGLSLVSKGLKKWPENEFSWFAHGPKLGAEELATLIGKVQSLELFWQRKGKSRGRGSGWGAWWLLHRALLCRDGRERKQGSWDIEVRVESSHKDNPWKERKPHSSLFFRPWWWGKEGVQSNSRRHRRLLLEATFMDIRVSERKEVLVSRSRTFHTHRPFLFSYSKRQRESFR